MEEHKSNHDAKNYFHLGEMLGYFFRKKDLKQKTNFNLKMMHGINKISMLIFLVGILYLIVKIVLDN